MSTATREPSRADLLSAIQRLNRKLERLEEKVEGGQQELVRLPDLAEELSISRSTMYRKLDRKGIPVRGASGFPKEDGDRSTAYVSRTEWESSGRLDTRTVRRHANAE
jgi:hypothetical protein